MQLRSVFADCNPRKSFAAFTRKLTMQSSACLYKGISTCDSGPERARRASRQLQMKLPGVISAAILTGALDFRLRVACEGQSDLVQLIETLRSRAGVQETNTTVILRELAGGMRLPHVHA